MNNIHDVRNLLKRFGTYIYTGDVRADLDLLEDECQELYENGLMEGDEFKLSLLIIRMEKSKLK